MASSRVRRGRDTEEVVAEYLRKKGWPDAERRPASLPGSDIMGIPGCDIEVKARADLDITGWIRQQHRRTDTTFDLPLLVYRPQGWGETRVAEYPAIMTLADWIDTFGRLL